MSKIFKITSGLLLILLLLNSCEEDNPLVASRKFNLDRFPTEIGTVWQYHRYDSLTNIQDTVTVTIIDGTDSCDCDSGYVWEFHYSANDSTENQMVHINGDTLTFFKFADGNFYVDYRIEFPIEVGKTWEGGQMVQDSCEVVGIEDVQPYSLRVLYKAHKVERSTWSFNDYGAYSYWYVPDIGMLKMVRRKIFWVAEFNDVWTMISYKKPGYMSLDEFPFEIGDSWVYEVYESNPCQNCPPDTVVATVTDGWVGIPEVNGVLLEFNSSSGTYFGSITWSQNRMEIFWGIGLVMFPLEYPLYTGKKWPSLNPKDTTRVVAQRPVTVPYGYYSNSFFIEGVNSGYDDGAAYKLWVEKNVGILRLDFTTHSMIPELNLIQSWKLIDFKKVNHSYNLTIGQYPSQVGTFWNYERYNNLEQVFDTIEVEIVDWTLGNDLPDYYTWVYRYNDHSDTDLVFILDNQIQVAHKGKIIVASSSIEFPLEIGKTWISYPFERGSEVESIEFVSVPLNNFHRSFKVATSYSCGDECGYLEHNWYVIDTGLVQKHEFKIEFIPDGHIFNEVVTQDNYWRLLEFYTPPIGIDQ